MEVQPSPLPSLSPAINRLAIVSLLSAILTLFFFCIGVAPIPLTSLVCYPASVFSGLTALVTGSVSLQQIRLRGEGGRPMAWAGVGIGGLTLLAVICAVVLVVFSLPSLGNYLQQAWRQIQR